jgi:antirestriction protein
MKAHLESIEEAIDKAGYNPHAFAVYLDNNHIPLEEWEDHTSDFEDSYAGSYDSRTEFTYEYLSSTGLLEPSQYKDNPSIETLIRYFDVDSFGRDLMNDYWETDGFYFRSY